MRPGLFATLRAATADERGVCDDLSSNDQDGRMAQLNRVLGTRVHPDGPY